MGSSLYCPAWWLPAYAIQQPIYPGYLEHVEPSIASVAYIFRYGAPLYHALDSVQRYAFPDGPMVFLPYVLALRAMGASVFPLKVIVLLANLAMLWLLWKFLPADTRCSPRAVGGGLCDRIPAHEAVMMSCRCGRTQRSSSASLLHYSRYSVGRRWCRPAYSH